MPHLDEARVPNTAKGVDVSLVLCIIGLISKRKTGLWKDKKKNPRSFTKLLVSHLGIRRKTQGLLVSASGVPMPQEFME